MKRNFTTGEIFKLLEERGRSLPHDADAERGVLAEMISGSRLASEIAGRIGAVDTEDSPFTSDWHTDIYRACLRLLEIGEAINPASVVRELKTFNSNANIELIRKLVIDYEPGSSRTYFESLLTAHRLRKLVVGCERAIGLAMLPEAGEQYARDEIEQIVFEAAESHSHGYTGISSYVQEILDDIAKPKVKLRGVLSGIRELDEITNGWQKTDLIVLIAKSGDGKTSLALHLAMSAAYSGTGIAFNSAEMNSLQIARRMLSHKSEINSFDIKRLNLSAEDKSAITLHAGSLKQCKIFIDDQSAISPIEIKSRLRKLMLREKIGLVVVDYFQLLSSAARRNSGTREQELGEISRALKGIAKDLRVPVICLAQVNKDAQNQKRRIYLSDVRECEALRMDADVGMAMMWDEAPEDRGMITLGAIDIQKHRDGPTGEVRVKFDRSNSRFYDEESQAEIVEDASKRFEVIGTTGIGNAELNFEKDYEPAF